MAGVAERHLCLFARTPRMGKVKRRLAATLGADGALAAHEALLRGAITRCFDGKGRQELWLTEVEQMPDWLIAAEAAGQFEIREQSAGDLGERMWDVLRQGLLRSRRCVLFGSDCPDIDAGYVAAAFEALADSDLVIGPAEDGGYGLIGLRRPLPGLFLDMRWGDAGVLQRTLNRAAVAGASVTLLPVIYDVDRIDDWRRYRSTNPDPPTGTGIE